MLVLVNPCGLCRTEIRVNEFSKLCFKWMRWKWDVPAQSVVLHYSHYPYYIKFYHIATKISALWLATRKSICAVSVQGARCDNIALQYKYDKKNSKWLIHKACQKISWNNMFSFKSQLHFWLNGKWI